jgi:hypothetical protein
MQHFYKNGEGRNRTGDTTIFREAAHESARSLKSLHILVIASPRALLGYRWIRVDIGGFGPERRLEVQNPPPRSTAGLCKSKAALMVYRSSGAVALRPSVDDAVRCA